MSIASLEEEFAHGPTYLMTWANFQDEYRTRKPIYDLLTETIAHDISKLLDKQGLLILGVNYRVKKPDSAYRKLRKASISLPFRDIKDLCGLRIIYYNLEDKERISAIINHEFDVIEVKEKGEELGATEFGYRSTHFIVKLKGGWLQPPSYRELGDIVFEIQIRTILMHVWAETEHKLQYKGSGEISRELKRKLGNLSSSFETADEQFKTLRAEITEYRSDAAVLERKLKDLGTSELNQDNLSKFINTVFPSSDDISSQHVSVERLTVLADKIKSEGNDMTWVVNEYRKTAGFLPEVISDRKDLYRTSRTFAYLLGKIDQIILLILLFNKDASREPWQEF